MYISNYEQLINEAEDSNH